MDRIFCLTKIIGLVVAFSFTSCTLVNDHSIKTSDFKPKVENFDFFIEGEIECKLLRYKQINYKRTNISNMYFMDSEETWLQAYSDSVSADGFWKIRLHDLDIQKIKLPYTLKKSEGNIGWFDSRVDLIIQATPFCQGVDNGCVFILSPDLGNITISSVKDRIIEGTFDGKAIILRTGFSPGMDENLFHDIKNGKFRIKYRV